MTSFVVFTLSRVTTVYRRPVFCSIFSVVGVQFQTTALFSFQRRRCSTLPAALFSFVRRIQSEVAVLAQTLRDIERDGIYYCSSIVENKTRAFRIIQKLLEAYVPAVLNYNESDAGKDTAENILYLSLSENYRYICNQANKKTKDETVQLYNRLLLVTDQISGMTDSKAMTIYQMISAI